MRTTSDKIFGFVAVKDGKAPSQIEQYLILAHVLILSVSFIIGTATPTVAALAHSPRVH